MLDTHHVQWLWVKLKVCVRWLGPALLPLLPSGKTGSCRSSSGVLPFSLPQLAFPCPTACCVPQTKVTSWHRASLKSCEWGCQQVWLCTSAHSFPITMEPWSGDRLPGRAELVLLVRGQHYAPVSVCTTHGYLQLPLYPSAAGAWLELAKQKLNQLSGEIKIRC